MIRDALAANRAAERWRRDLSRAARAHAAALGYDGTVRIVKQRHGAGYELALQQERGVEMNRLKAPVGPNSHGSLEKTIAQLVDLAKIARRRRDAIEAARGSTCWAPAWSYLGHPVARALYGAMGQDLAEWCPNSDGNLLHGVTEGLQIREFRIATAGASAKVNGILIRIHAQDELARITINQRLPETLVMAMKGKPLRDVLGLPGLEAGTPAGDAPIRTARGGDSTMVTVECALEPMGTPPAGADLSFLTEWAERHRI